MRRRPQVIVVWALVGALMTGCTGSELASLPGDMSDTTVMVAPMRVLKVGDKAKITLRSGSTIDGEVTAIFAGTVTVERTADFGREEHEIAAAEIARIDRVTAGSSWLVFAGAGVGAALIWAAAELGEHMD